MEQILSKLSEIEITAKSIMDDAAYKKQRLSDEMEQKFKDFDAQLDKETEHKIQQIRADLEKEKDVQLDALKKDTEQTLADLDSYFQKNHRQLAEELYRKIISL
jgi:hypothetical protein